MKNIKTYEEYRKSITFKQHLEEYENIDLSKIKLFICGGSRLKDLNGVEIFTNLIELACYDNKIKSLEPLANMVNLRSLVCWDNKITSLKPILNLTNLYDLDCERNPINWIDYIDEKGNIWYIELPKSITRLKSDKFEDIEEYKRFMDKNQPVAVSRKFKF